MSLGRRSSGTATVLFTDLSGSAELMTSLGDLAYNDLRVEHFGRLREVIGACGGEEVKTTGDGLLVTFGGAADAVAAAVAIQQATERHGRRSDLPLSVRVGVALGDVTFEAGDVFGTPVVEAARLVAAARPGQILVAGVVRTVAGSRCQHPFSDLGSLDLKGLPAAITVCEVGWDPSDEAVIPPMPLPPLLLGRGRIFVGRDDELERLRQRWKEVGTGGRRLVLIGGEPGVGKSRLATHLARELHGDGAIVLAGRCDEDLGVPYQPFVEALRHYVTHAPHPRLGRHGGELSRLLPEVSQLVAGLPAPMHSDPETERYRLFDSVAAWLSDISTESPVLVVIDDLQWAAKPTLLLLRHVLRSSEPMKLLLAGTYRDTDVGRGHPLAELLADVPLLEEAERIALIGLDVAAVRAFLEHAAGHELGEEADELAQALWRETEGNAFFVIEVLRHLAESRAIEQRDGRWTLTTAIPDLGIPEGVRDVVGRRLSRLSDDANRVLACAAVVGLEFDARLVQAAGGFSEDAVIGGLEDAVANRLVVELPGASLRNRFAHGLVRSTLYDELTAARRVSLHRRVAEAIEATHADALDDHLPALTHHWARAAAPAADAARAVQYAVRAGDRALEQFANDEAVIYYRQALELWDASGFADAERRVDVLIALGEAQRRAGDAAHHATLREAARLAQEHGDGGRLARAALANSRGIFSATARIDPARLEVLDAALAAVGDQDSTTRARLLATMAGELVFSPDNERRQQLMTDAMTLARRLGDAATLGHVLVRHYSTALAARAEVAELAAVAAQKNDPALDFWAAHLAACSAVVFADRAELEHHLAVAQDLARKLGQPFLQWVSGLVRVNQVRIAGDLPHAEALAREVFTIGQTAGIPDATLIEGTHLLWIRFDQGRLDELMDRLSRASSRRNAPPLALATFAVALCELDRSSEAAGILDGLAADGFRVFPTNYLWLHSMSLAAEVCAAIGHTGHAAVLYAQLVPHHGLVGSSGAAATGTVDHFLGLLATTLGRYDEADTHFRSAAAIHEEMGAPIWLARTRLEWAQMLMRRGRPDDAHTARRLLDQTRAAATALGLGTVERRAQALLN